MQRDARNCFRVAALLTGTVLLGIDAGGESPAARFPSQLGIEDHLREWPELTATPRDRASRDLPAADMARIQNLLDEAYSTERLQLGIEQAILADASPDEARELYCALRRIYVGDEALPGADPSKLSELTAAYRAIRQCPSIGEAA